MKRSGKFLSLFKPIKTALSLILVFAAAFCVFRRIPECFNSDAPAALAAAAFTLTDGTYRLDMSDSGTETETDKVAEPTAPSKKTDESKEKKIRDKSDYYNSFAAHEGEEKFDVTEKTYGADGIKLENGYIKNRTGLDVDFDALLKDELTFSVDKNADEPQVLIYHTHTSESYLDEDVDYFYESFYSRTQNTDFNVVAVGEAIAEALNEKGINTIHNKTVHDSTYKGSYSRSVQTAEADMNKHKSIKVILDIHRDAIGSETNKVKPVFTHNGKKCAQIMIMSGCDATGDMGFLNWKNNLNFALKIHNTAEKMYPGMTRPLNFGYFTYNEYVCDGSLLIEVGTDANSIEEAVNTGELLGKVLAEVL